MRFFKRFLVAMLCMAVLCSTATAAGESLALTYEKITQDGFVADSLNGVDAMYNLYGPTLYCVDLVSRYYEQVYGMEIQFHANPYVKVDGAASSEYWLEETEVPKTGDILYGSAGARGRGYNHWALVKSYDPATGVITVFEQNWRWNGNAGVDRQIAWPSRYYECFTLKSTSGVPEAMLPAAHQRSAWADEAVLQAQNDGVAIVADGYQTSVTAADFCAMLEKQIAAQTGLALDAEQDPCTAAADMGLAAAGLNADAPVSWTLATNLLRGAADLMGGDGQSLLGLEVDEDADQIFLGANALVVPASPNADSGSVSVEQAIALTMWIGVHGGDSFAVTPALARMAVEAPQQQTNVLANVISASMDNMFVTRTADYYTGR
ncbi:MAG: hypothetical protein PHS97_06725 [Oscillospiraceae bacterium]|nr:hypothetical protein [Oscillospiraceae bacterium]